MRLSEVVMGSLIAVGCAGCPGTIEDLSGFKELASQRDAGAEPEDAGVDAAEAPAQDAALDAALDASQSSEAGSSEEDAETEVDGSWQRDAEEAPTPEAGTDSSLGCDFQFVIRQNCGDAECHGAPPVTNTLDLMSPDLAERLAGRMATKLCANYLLIDPDNPSRSAIYVKTTRDACGPKMPLGDTLNDAEQACILEWIESLK